jgi:hypothetical protein
MMRSVVLVAAFVAAGGLAVPAATLPTFFPANPGERLQLHITRTSQGFDQPVIAQSELVVQRKTADAFVVERTQNGTTFDSVLTIDAGGTLQLAPSERSAASNADVRALLPVLAIALDVANDTAPPGGSVLLSLPVGEARATASLVVPMRTANLIGNDFALHGTATTQLQPAANGATREPPSQGRRRGGFGGGFPGGGSPGAGAPGGGSQRPAAAAPSAMNVLVRIDGQVAGGRVRTLTIAQTREIIVGGTPFVSTDSWTIEVQ